MCAPPELAHRGWSRIRERGERELPLHADERRIGVCCLEGAAVGSSLDRPAHGVLQGADEEGTQRGEGDQSRYRVRVAGTLDARAATEPLAVEEEGQQGNTGH